MGYRNYRCRICGQYISQWTLYYDGISERTASGMLITRKYHPHCTDLADGERALCDLVSISEEPIERAVEVHTKEDVESCTKMD